MTNAFAPFTGISSSTCNAKHLLYRRPPRLPHSSLCISPRSVLTCPRMTGPVTESKSPPLGELPSIALSSVPYAPPSESYHTDAMHGTHVNLVTPASLWNSQLPQERHEAFEYCLIPCSRSDARQHNTSLVPNDSHVCILRLYLPNTQLIARIDTTLVPLCLVVSPFASACPVDVANLPPFDLLVLSHNHYDHLSTPTLQKIAKLPSPPHVIVPLNTIRCLTGESAGFQPDQTTELDWWEGCEVTFKLPSASEQEGEGIDVAMRVTGAPAQHMTARGVFDKSVPGRFRWLTRARLPLCNPIC